MVQDQMAAQHPGGPLAAGVISEAAGLLVVKKKMVVMPDDPALGEYQSEFAGMVGIFYAFPMPASEEREGYKGATEIIGQKELYKRLLAGYGDAVSIRAFLRARLIDLMLGDFDRHRKQWRWAKLPGEDLWQPIPEDRDMAFVRYNGAGTRIGSLYVPILQSYGPKYPWIKGLTMHGWEQDRYLLAALSWRDWEEIVNDLQSRISDDVIEQAIAALPPEYAEIDGDRLRHDLTGRRDRLPDGARRFFEHLAGKVDVQGTDAAEIVSVERFADGRTLIEVRPSEPEGAEAVFSRSFNPDDTSEVRVYLRGGDDVVKVIGKKSPIKLRVIAEGGSKNVDDREGGKTVIYDSNDSVEVEKGPRTKIKSRPYELPPSNSGFVDVGNVPPRDWGYDVTPLPVFGYEKDVGVFLGGGATYTKYGFRKHPWASQHSLSAGWAFEASQPKIRYEGAYRPENRRSLVRLDLQYSGIEILRFYGLGNETSDEESDSFYRVKNEQVRVIPNIRVPLNSDETLTFATGPVVSYSNTRDDEGDRSFQWLPEFLVFRQSECFRQGHHSHSLIVHVSQ
jgi:hypothetical protein